MQTQNYSILIDKISALSDKYNTSYNPEYKDLVNYSQNSKKPMHNWFKYKEGYSAELIKELLERFNYQ